MNRQVQAWTDKRIRDAVLRFNAGLDESGIHGRKIILYGSYAEGRANEHSDIDLIVVSDDFEGMDLWERQCALGDSTAGILEPIEALGYTTA